MIEAQSSRSDTFTEVGVRFRHNPKVYSFSAEGMRLSIGDRVLVRSEKGVDMGEVMELRGRVSNERAAELMPVVRKATREDLDHIEEQEQRERQALKVCAEKIAEHNLPMKLIDSSLSFDNTRLVFFFSAEGRVDFRELVRDLARTCRLRIELRQIGVRDEAKLLGGLGPCGRRLCCKSFMRDFEPVGIRVAKDQGLALNPNKISGLCDRLMCCLLFEHDTYKRLRRELPNRGERVMTPDGPGVVTNVSLLKEQVQVQLQDGSEVKVAARDLLKPGEVPPCAECEQPCHGETAAPEEQPEEQPARQPAPERPAPERRDESGKSGGGGSRRRGRRSSRGGKQSEQQSSQQQRQADGKPQPSERQKPQENKSQSGAQSGSGDDKKKQSSRRRRGGRRSKPSGGQQQTGSGGSQRSNDGGKN